MKVIRKSVFETNSSSMHSLAYKVGKNNEIELDTDFNHELSDFYYDKNNPMKYSSNKYFIIVLDAEYGWHLNILTEKIDRLKYLLTVIYDEVGRNIMKKIYEERDLGKKTKITESKVLKELRKSQDFIDVQTLFKEVTGKTLVVPKINLDEARIDHQSSFNSMSDFLTHYGLTLKQYLFGKDNKVIIYNDNENFTYELNDMFEKTGYKIKSSVER